MAETMRVFYTIVVCLVIGGIADPGKLIDNENETDIRVLYANLERRLANLELKLVNVEKEKENKKRADSSLLNDTNLEERVQALELKLSKVESRSQASSSSLLPNDTNLEERFSGFGIPDGQHP